MKFYCGLPLSGDNRIRLAVNEGHVDTTPLYTSDLPFVFGTAHALSARGDPERVPLERFCIGLDSMGRKGSWLWVQVVHHFGLAVDNYVLAETNHHDVERERRSGQSGHAEALELDIDEALMNQGQQRAARKRKRAGALKITFNPVATMNFKLLQYFLCMRAFFKGCAVLHGSFDASRVGNVNRLFGLLTRPDNYAAWLHPVVTHVNEAQCTAFSLGSERKDTR